MATAGCVKLLFYICEFEYQQPHLFLGRKKKHDISSSGPNFHCFCFTLLRSCFIFPEKYTSCIAWFHIFCFAFVSLSTTHVPKRQKLYVLHMMASVSYSIQVTLCLRYSMYWFLRYNISFRQNLSGCHGQSCALYHNHHKDHLSNSYKEEGLYKRRLPRRTSSEIASAKIAGRSIPGKVRRSSFICGLGKKTVVFVGSFYSTISPNHSRFDCSNMRWLKPNNKL